MQNPLLIDFNTPFKSSPFNQIKNRHYLPAFKQAITWAKKEIESISSNSEPPTFKNTIEAMELSGETLNRISSIFFNLNAAETNDELQQIAQEVSPLLSEFSNDIRLNPTLFKRIETLYKQKDELNLTAEQNRLLEIKYKNFSRNGANLLDDQKIKLREIDAELSQLSLQFGQNVLAETNAYKLLISNENDLAGLPKDVIDAAKQEAELQQTNGWVFTLHAPSFMPFMKFAKNRELRKELFLAYGKKAFKNNEFNNEENVKRIANLRLKRANLLGYKTHAHFVLEERMANSPQIVEDFLSDLLQNAKPFAEEEIKTLQIFAKEKDGIETLQRWDHAYYSEMLKKSTFNLSDDVLKPYFSLNKVLEGAFTIAHKLYGLDFKVNSHIATYHKDVNVYEVLNENKEHLALLYTDFFPRKGKRAGAWMTEFKGQSNINGNHKRPHISIVCNFSKPTNETPSLLTFNEVTTLFHEFGHALHGILANTTYESLSGTNVYYDFVELPSQFMENYCFENEALELFAKHYKTDEVIPQDLIEKVKKSANFMEGYQTVRQLSFGLLDMAYHAGTLENLTSISDFEQQAFAPTELYPPINGTNMSVAFSHIFQGGYSSGYYSYKWSEVLDADAFAYFKETGIFNPITAQKFKHLLASGGSIDPMELYTTFRGKKPNPKALLERAGLV